MVPKVQNLDTALDRRACPLQRQTRLLRFDDHVSMLHAF